MLYEIFSGGLAVSFIPLEVRISAMTFLLILCSPLLWFIDYMAADISHITSLIFFSVSVKMNMLLYAPGVLLVLLIATGLKETIICLSICAAIQLILGYPFLSTYPVEYLMRSFDVRRVFEYKWTVNLKFLPEEIFKGKALSGILLLLTIAGIIRYYLLSTWIYRHQN